MAGNPPESLGDDFFEQILAVPQSYTAGGGGSGEVGSMPMVLQLGSGGSSSVAGGGGGGGGVGGFRGVGMGMGMPLGLNLEQGFMRHDRFREELEPNNNNNNNNTNHTSAINERDSVQMGSLFPAFGHLQSQSLRPTPPPPPPQLHQPFHIAPAATAPQPPAIRPRVRARRGQATDPHSIAERLRRERIAERMKALQELVPSCNKIFFGDQHNPPKFPLTMSSSSSSSEVILDSNEKSAKVSSLSSSFHPLPPSYQSSRSLRGGFEPGDSRRMTGFCDLPEKVVVEIMSWLPPRSLFRLKCVQKSWYSLISNLVKSQWFVAKHLKNSQSNSYVFQRNSPLCCLQRRNDKSRNWFMSFNKAENMNGRNYSFNKAENCNNRIYFDVKEFNVPRCITGGYGSHCNGILFLADRKTNKVLLFNPALRELKLLQSSCFGSNFKTLVMAGFGYDAIADVYKVIRVVGLCSTAVGARIRAEVCTLGNHGDSWREIKMKIEIDVSSLTLDEVNHRGVCYWVICDKFSMKKMLISFDLHEEEFQIIPFPDDHDREEFGATSAATIIDWRLFMWNERVTLLRNVASISPWPPNSDAKHMRMWLLDEISSGNLQKKAFCWTKYADLLSGGNLSYFPIVFWRNDELLCFTYPKGLVSYNLSTQKRRTVELDPPENGYFHAFVYVESLVSIEGARQMI